MLTFIEDLGVIEYGNKGNRRRHWKMQCDCGDILTIPTNNVKSGNTTKCKLCANRASAKDAIVEAAAQFSLKHKLYMQMLTIMSILSIQVHLISLQ